MVVARSFVGADLEAKIREHQGVIFDARAKAEEAADAINDEAAGDGQGILPEPSNGAHFTGFSKQVSIEGMRLYIPIRRLDVSST
ncbi:hypothetical protein [Streptomyces noursei]|uniref:Uncharacterized protein n=1 Tax=Streptomyces noursei TaxID=1971 RepID=A0A2N8PQU9_STRNR|nr:hypothetical protein [Streptomyces noursei]PNE43404.1 hypothetical protein AOB60_00190 [Streptomyces noursei]